MDVINKLKILSNMENSINSTNKELDCNITKHTIQETRNTKVLSLKRHYINVFERRMPWSIFPYLNQLSLEQKIHIMALYKKQQGIYKYHRAKASLIFAEWNDAFIIPIYNNKLVSEVKPVTQSRSGRLIKNIPHYIDDGSDSESIIKKKVRKRNKKFSEDDPVLQNNLLKEPISLPINDNTIKNNEMSYDIIRINENINDVDIISGFDDNKNATNEYVFNSDNSININKKTNFNTNTRGRSKRIKVSIQDT